MNVGDRIEAAKRQMVERQLRRRGIVDRRVLAAMRLVPRQRFVPELDPVEAYADRAWPIACDQTISQPYIVALMTQALELEGRERVLEIGTGSGYQAAVLSRLCREVVTIERHAELAAQAGAILDDLGYVNVERIVADGSLGWPPLAPYDRIIVTAAAEQPPPALLAQVAVDGRLVIPVGASDGQELQVYHRRDDQFEITNLTGCRFVPLVGQQGQPE